MGIQETIRQAALNFLIGNGSYTGEAQRQALEQYARLRDYYVGRQKRPLRPKPNQFDDNLTVNLMGLIIERSISMLFGQGIHFDLPGEGESPQDAYLAANWKFNRQPILLHKLGQLGGVYGTCYVKLLPQTTLAPDGRPLVRQVPLMPWTMRVETEPHDMDTVVRYVQEYVLGQGDRAVAHRFVTERVLASALTDTGQIYQTNEVSGWQETHYQASRQTNGRWEQVGDVADWDYAFAPIVHWQNLIDAEAPYGRSDLGDVLELQDRYNLIEANISKIIRYHAHPKTWGRGALGGQAVSWGADEIVWLSGDQSQVANLEMQSDLASSRSFGLDLRQAIFDIARSIDTQSLADKLGALTNFGLRVLFMDALAKNHTKRELYGEGLTELNRRALQLAGFTPEQADPGTITWPDPLPADDSEQVAAMDSEIANEIASRETWRTKRGYDAEVEAERVAAEKKDRANLGSELLGALTQGRPGIGQPQGDGVSTDMPVATSNLQGVALNGAQVAAAMDIVLQVTAGTLSYETGLGSLQVLFGLTDEQARRLLPLDQARDVQRAALAKASVGIGGAPGA